MAVAARWKLLASRVRATGVRATKIVARRFGVQDYHSDLGHEES